jgi:hypothetical protein
MFAVFDRNVFNECLLCLTEICVICTYIHSGMEHTNVKILATDMTFAIDHVEFPA